MTTTNDAETIADLARKAACSSQIITTPSGREYLVTPKDQTAVEVTPANKTDVLTPKLIKQMVILQTADALVEYLGRFKGANSLLFADVEHSKLVAAIDYHGKDSPAHVAHCAVLALPFAEEWKIWKDVDGKLMPQLDFARFIEENAPDIKAPDAGTLLESVRDLQARRNVNFIAAVRTNTDNESFEYTDNTEARTKNDIELPTKFLLNIPVYFGEAPGEVHAFLRWQLVDTRLHLGIKLHRAEYIRQAAFNLIVTGVTERSGVTSVFGRI